jgi:hypothetical protein
MGNTAAVVGCFWRVSVGFHGQNTDNRAPDARLGGVVGWLEAKPGKRLVMSGDSPAKSTTKQQQKMTALMILGNGSVRSKN